MSSRRTAILIGAIAIGVVAVFLIYGYVKSLENKANEDSAPVPVYVAKETVKRGTEGKQAIDSNQITAAEIPQKYRPATAIQTPDAITKKVALFDIAPGTVIVEGMFVDQSVTQISFRERLKNKNHVAISIAVDQVHGVGGFLVPGDQVNMMILQDNAQFGQAINSTDEAAKKPIWLGEFDIVKPVDPQNLVRVGGPQWIFLDKTARYMYQKVSVLAVGSTQLLTPGEQAADASKTNTAPNNTGLITFNVPPEAAQWIATGQEKGFYLSLVAQEYAPQKLPPLPVFTDVLPGEDPGKYCPYYNDEKGCA